MLGIVIVCSHRAKYSRPGRQRLQLPAATAIGLSMTCIHCALDLGKVSVVIPIGSTGPFFSLIFSALFLRDVERVTLRIVLAAAMIVGGVLLITMWK